MIPGRLVSPSHEGCDRRCGPRGAVRGLCLSGPRGAPTSAASEITRKEQCAAGSARATPNHAKAGGSVKGDRETHRHRPARLHAGRQHVRQNSWSQTRFLRTSGSKSYSSLNHRKNSSLHSSVRND
jgi:hypothetical protein